VVQSACHGTKINACMSVVGDWNDTRLSLIIRHIAQEVLCLVSRAFNQSSVCLSLSVSLGVDLRRSSLPCMLCGFFRCECNTEYNEHNIYTYLSTVHMLLFGQ
jgi:hypothetical protein